MNKQKNKRNRFFANKMHQEVFILIFCAALLPALIATISLFYLIFNITAEQLGIPEAIAYNLIPAARRVMTILFIATPLSILAILIFAHRITHRIIGPFDRIVKELAECIDSTEQEHINIRKNDKFRPLVDKINILLDRLKKV
ncbi:MAG: hypothetical protein ISS47_00010 [Candidatus Omnitrophica bacterium]|nr:hypothetical protein [Candidatus Omnitrophota bacterium]